MLKTPLEIASPVLKDLLDRLTKGRKHAEHLTDAEIKKLGNLLTGRMVFLLRCMDEYPGPSYPRAWVSGMASYVDFPESQFPEDESGPWDAWEKAIEYACCYLSLLGLVEFYGGFGREVRISQLGIQLIRSETIRNLFRDSFRQKTPYRG